MLSRIIGLIGARRNQTCRQVCCGGTLWAAARTISVIACVIACLADGAVADDAIKQDVEKTQRIIVVVGAAGEDTYRETFAAWQEDWAAMAQKRNWDLVSIGGDTAGESTASQDVSSQKSRLKEAVETVGPEVTRLWVVMIGHGTFAASGAKFNLVGEDVAAAEFSQWLASAECPVVVAGCFSASGAFLPKLSGPGRMVISATRSGSERNYSRFGGALAEAISDASADLDHDDEVSLLESFLFASASTQRFYKDNSRLATEHALLDDNADKAGTPADFYVGTRSVGKAKDGKKVDGKAAGRVIVASLPGAIKFTAELAAERAELETQIDGLIARKAETDSQEYLDALESLMLDLARVYDEAEAL